MTFQEYQEHALETAMYPDAGSNFVYPTLGLANEAGEVAGKVKKIFRDDNGHVTPERLEDIKGELGDVLWYTAQVASEFKLSLEDIASANLTKLASRKQRGVLQGSGDNR